MFGRAFFLIHNIMRSTSELLDMQTRGESVKPNPRNKVTTKRKNLGRNIMAKANDVPSEAYQYSMALLNDSIPRMQEFVLSHGETPAYSLNNLVKQVYQLRMIDVNEAENTFDFDTEEAITHLENQEADFYNDHGYVMDEFLGELFAPIELAVAYMQNNNANGNPDGFVDAGLLQGVVNTIGTKVNSTQLVRAAKGKSANIFSGLSTGGKKHYNALKAYFKQYPDVAKKVIDGIITDESQLPNWNVVASANGVNAGINNTINDLAADQMKRAIPYVIGFVVIIAIVVYFAARAKK